MIYESERLNFRPIDQGDLDELFNVWGNSETMRFCGDMITKRENSHLIEYSCSQYNMYGNTVFAVIKDDKLLGICGGKLDEDDPFHVEIVVHLSKEYQHQGYGAEVIYVTRLN